MSFAKRRNRERRPMQSGITRKRSAVMMLLFKSQNKFSLFLFYSFNTLRKASAAKY
jgi:hypothetical protein